MGEKIGLTAADEHEFSVWRAGDGPGLVVIQEIFGVNSHIRNVVDRFADKGFAAVAPALFDRIGPGHELGYEADDVAKGRDLRAQCGNEAAILDVRAAVDLLVSEGRKVAVVGYCWGGSLAWKSACEIAGLACSVGYYGGEITKNADAVPLCPVMLHFGETDHAIPMEDVETVKTNQPDVPIHVYPAGHGFSCDERGSYHADSHELALERTLDFLRRHLASGTRASRENLPRPQSCYSLHIPRDQYRVASI
ncbi:MAG: dienelactone hydrolase family protein, partial [Pseudomonadota bacterium]